MVEQVSDVERELHQTSGDDLTQDDFRTLGDLGSTLLLAQSGNTDLLEELYELVKDDSFDDGSSSLF